VIPVKIRLAMQAEHQLEIGRAKRAFAGLVDDRLAIGRREVGYDFPAGLAAHQDAPARTGIADAGADPAGAPALVCRQVGKIRAMAFAGVEHMKPVAAHRRQNRADRRDRRAGQ
jgi:hypothetical protein